MKKLVMAAVALTALGATPALATTNPGATFTVQGSVDAKCGAFNDDTINFGTISTGNDGVVDDSRSLSSTGQNVFCNGAGSTITITKNNMTNGTGAADPFTNTITFSADVSVDGNSYGDGDTVGITAGDLVVTASNLSSSGKIPVAGNYEGSVVVTLTPGL